MQTIVRRALLSTLLLGTSSGSCSEALQAAHEPHATEIMGDVPNFIDVTPIFQVNKMLTVQPLRLRTAGIGRSDHSLPSCAMAWHCPDAHAPAGALAGPRAATASG